MLFICSSPAARERRNWVAQLGHLKVDPDHQLAERWTRNSLVRP